MKQEQNDVKKWMKKNNLKYWTPLEMIARIAEELGETARITNQVYGNKRVKPNEKIGELGEELTDIIFAIICYANFLNINLDKEWKKVMLKVQLRELKE